MESKLAELDVPKEERKGSSIPEHNLDNFKRLIIHLDMDAYYAQVEIK